MGGLTPPGQAGDRASSPDNRNADVHAALERIRASQTFSNSRKLFALLEFLVLSAVRGERDALKETSIGVDFYGREPAYDPKKDSIVRTQASRLRDRLEEYYRNEGANDPLVIELVRGSYVPEIHLRVAVDLPLQVQSRTEIRVAVKPVRRWAVLAGVLTVVALAVGAYLFAPRAALNVSNYTQLTHDGQPKWLVGTDGVRLFVGTGSLFTPGLAEVAIGGGELVPITIPRSGLRPLDISSSGDQILLAGYDPPNLWSLRLVGGSLQRLGDVAGAEADWSPDGTKLAIANRNQVWVAGADGSNPRSLADLPSLRLYALGWSPDGTRLRFSKWQANGSPSLWEISADGGGLHQLLAGWHQPPDEGNGRWTPDGRYYMFQSRDQIWALPSRGVLASPARLTNSPLKMSSPLPGKDGKTLYAVGRTERGTLVRYDSSSRTFEPYLGGLSGDFVAFSKDGEWVTYVSYPDGTLWRMRKDGRDRIRLTSPPTHPVLPRWSPDGKEVVFSVKNQADAAQCYSVSFDGGKVNRLYPDAPVGLNDAAWAPDGSRMAFSLSNLSGPAEVWMTDPGGQNPHLVPGGQGRFAPRWSPDGQQIVAMRQQPVGLALLDVGTGKWSDLATINGGFSNWSHDGRYVYFLRFPEQPAVVRIEVATRKVETVVELKDLRMTGFFSAWLGLAPDDSPLLLRDTGTQDVYALELSR
jgi:Tol biopolymer transport system component